MFGALIFLAMFLAKGLRRPGPPIDESFCAGPRLVTVDARERAMSDGYEIDGLYDCITRASYDAVNAQKVAHDQARSARLADERTAIAVAGQPHLTQARHGFETRIGRRNPAPQPLPQPPAQLFVRSDYKNAQNYTLPAFVTPDPQDGERHPAIVWLTGGDSSALGDFWTPGAADNDQSARAFRDAGVVMLFPTLRGGHDTESNQEWLLGEVDDVLAAAAQLARLRYVDPERIYLGGHSTGGTLALLAAAMQTPFKAVFAFGPVAEVQSYAPQLIPVDFRSADPLEAKLRSPIHWLDDIRQPTFIIEGNQMPANNVDYDALCARSRNPQLQCLRIVDADHFSVLSKVTPVIAAKIAVNPPGKPLKLELAEFAQ